MTAFGSLMPVVALVLMHLVVGNLRLLAGTPRSAWLSGAGGVSVAYVFVHLLPELAEGQKSVSERLGEGVAFLERHVYLLALLGSVVFYGLERAAVVARRHHRGVDGGETAGVRTFWLHMVSFGIYNALIGYLLRQHEEEGRDQLLALFAIAMGLHFLVTDYGLREHHKSAYLRVGRWILGAAIIVGWTVGLVRDVSEAVQAIILAFLAGGVILNVLKEELPEERESRFWAFALGAAAYAALLLAL